MIGAPPRSLERAFELAGSGECSTVAEIKQRLRTERLDDSQVFGPTLLAELRRRMAEAQGEGSLPCGSAGQPRRSV